MLSLIIYAFSNIIIDIMTDSSAPEKKTKGELEQLVKANGGNIYQINTAASDMICVGERRTSEALAISS